MRNETIAAEVRPAYFVRMIFDNSVLNIWTGTGNIAFGGNTYTGTGDLLNISEITESAELQATGINVTLTGIKSSFLVIAKDEQYQGRELIVSFGAFTTAGALIADPAIVFSGFMDTMTITEAAEYSTITVAVENKLIAFERSLAFSFHFVFRTESSGHPMTALRDYMSEETSFDITFYWSYTVK